MKTCSTCNNGGRNEYRSGSSKKSYRRPQKDRDYDSESNWSRTGTNSDYDHHSAGRKLVFETRSGQEAAFLCLDTSKQYYIVDKLITLPQLILDINESFGSKIPVQGVFVQFTKVYNYEHKCCASGKCVGWVVNILCPKKIKCSKDLVATMWSFVVLCNGQLLLKTVESPPVPAEGHCNRNRDSDNCCDGHYSFEALKRNIPVYDCNAKLVTHQIYAPMDVIGVCGAYSCMAGCGTLTGTLCYDGKYSDRFYKDIVNACCSDKDPRTYPLFLHYEICLMERPNDVD